VTVVLVIFIHRLRLRVTKLCAVSSPAIWWRLVDRNYWKRKGVHAEQRHVSCLISWFEHVV